MLTFKHLSQVLLLLAGEGRSSSDFYREIARLVAGFTVADLLELRLRDGNRTDLWIYDPEGRELSCLNDGPAKLDLAKYPSRATVPLAIGEHDFGVLTLFALEPDFFSAAKQTLYRDVGRTLGIAIAYHRTHNAQRERVKELSCLYQLARIASQPDVDINALLAQIVLVLPPAWQYPEVTCAEIRLNEKHFVAGPQQPALSVQRADIVARGVVLGAIEIGYVRRMPVADDGPFLHEESRLLETIAREVSLLVERKQAEVESAQLQTQLAHADRLATTGKLAAGIAHELNEPLGAILGFAQLAAKQPELSPQLSHDLERIEAATLHARKIVAQLSLFARQTPACRVRMDFNEAVEDALVFLRPRCQKARVQVVRGSRPLPPIEADRGQMIQVVINLAVNAVQAMEGGGTLNVETSVTDDGQVRLVVTDTGHGIDSTISSRLFEPFFTTKDVGEGTGLGLSVLHGIVAAHGGQVSVQSSPGAGARFEVCLPAARPDHNGNA